MSRNKEGKDMEFMENTVFKQEQEKNISYIEDVLKNYLPKNPSFQKTIYDGIQCYGGRKTPSPYDDVSGI